MNIPTPPLPLGASRKRQKTSHEPRTSGGFIEDIRDGQDNPTGDTLAFKELLESWVEPVQELYQVIDMMGFGYAFRVKSVVPGLFKTWYGTSTKMMNASLEQVGTDNATAKDRLADLVRRVAYYAMPPGEFWLSKPIISGCKSL